MTSVSVPWGMWYEDDKFDLTFPNTWSVTVSEMKGGPDIGESGIRQALAEPIDALPLREVARSRRDAAILIDDLTRPTPSYRVLPYILEELAAAGMDHDRVRIVCGSGAHRPLTRQDFVKKIGLEQVNRLQVINHNIYDNLEFYGNSSQGIPIWVNREFARSDLKIAAGMMTPREDCFGGGSKLLAIGASAWQTIYATHTYCPNDLFRHHMDEVARMVGLEYIVTVLLNQELEITGMVAGDPDEAFRRGVEMGRELYHTEMPEGMDVAVCNAWPKDTEGTQASMACVPLYNTRREVLKENGTVVITSACSEGLGFHAVFGPGTRALASYLSTGWTPVPKARHVLFSPNLNKYDVHDVFGEDFVFCKTWSEVMAVLEREHGTSARVVVFPCGAIQYGGWS